MNMKEKFICCPLPTASSEAQARPEARGLGRDGRGADGGHVGREHGARGNRQALAAAGMNGVGAMAAAVVVRTAAAAV